MRARRIFVVGAGTSAAIAAYTWRTFLWDVTTNIIGNLGANGIMVAFKFLISHPSFWLLTGIFLVLGLYLFVRLFKRNSAIILLLIIVLGWWSFQNRNPETLTNRDSTPAAQSDLDREELPRSDTPTPAVTTQPEVTSTSLPDCQHASPPCLEPVLAPDPNTGERDSLSGMARRVWHIRGDVDPRYAQAICDANWRLLEEQFRRNLTQHERETVWGNDPCNYLVPGTKLIIPTMPEF